MAIVILGLRIFVTCKNVAGRGPRVATLVIVLDIGYRVLSDLPLNVKMPIVPGMRAFKLPVFLMSRLPISNRRTDGVRRGLFQCFSPSMVV